MESAQSEPPIYGRDQEIDRLSEVVDGDGSWPRGAVLVGPSGIGKTRLLARACEQSEAAGAIVLRGSCLDLGDAWPLHPFREASLRLAAGGLLPAESRLLELLDGNDGDWLPSTGQALAIVHSEIASLATDAKVVLAIDDLQWADTSTSRLLLTLLSGLTSGRICLLAGIRDDMIDGSSTPLIADLYRLSAVEVLELKPLDESATVELARDVSQRALSRQDTTRLWRRSGGSPILIIELARHADLGEETPAAVRSQLQARLMSLPDRPLELIRVASLGTGPVHHDVIRQVMEVDDDGVVAAARQAVAAGVLRAEPEGYEPIHDLFREVARDTLLAPERVVLHRRIAKAMEVVAGSVQSEPIELAHHWVGAGDGARALMPFVAAARHATKLGAESEAWQHWKVATDILTDRPYDADVVGLLCEAAEAAHVADQHGPAIQLVAWAQRHLTTQGPVVPTRQLAEVRLARSRYLASAGELVGAEQICSEIFVDTQVPLALAIEAGARSSDLLTQLGRYEAALTRAAETLDRADDGHPFESAKLLASAAKGYSSACLGDPDTGRRSLIEALERADRSGKAQLIEAASRHYADLLMGPLNELEAGVALAMERADDLSAKGADPRFTTALLALATTGLFRLGRWREACRSATAALESDPTGPGTIDLLLGRARVVLGLGDFDIAERDLNAVSNLIGTHPNPRHALPFATLRAGLAMWREDPETAREEVDYALRRLEADEFDDPWLVAPLLWHGIRAEAVGVAIGLRPDVGRAEQLMAAMERLHAETDVADSDEADLLEAYKLLCEGELNWVRGRPDAQTWSDAAAIWERCGHPYPSAYSHLQQARALFGSRTRNRKGRLALGTAYQISESLAAQPLSTEIRKLAQRARIDLDEDKSSGIKEPEQSADSILASLTARELEVIAEVAEGLSNREIGERLYISGRTVGVHISSILSKLGVRTRVEAATLYSREQSARDRQI